MVRYFCGKQSINACLIRGDSAPDPTLVREGDYLYVYHYIYLCVYLYGSYQPKTIEYAQTLRLFVGYDDTLAPCHPVFEIFGKFVFAPNEVLWGGMVFVQFFGGRMVRTPGDNFLNMFWLHVDWRGANNAPVGRPAGSSKTDWTCTAHANIELVQQFGILKRIMENAYSRTSL